LGLGESLLVVGCRIWGFDRNGRRGRVFYRLFCRLFCWFFGGLSGRIGWLGGFGWFGGFRGDGFLEKRLITYECLYGCDESIVKS